MIENMAFSGWQRVAFLLLALCLIAADQSLKIWALQHLQEGQPPLPFFAGIEWFLTFNTGAAWSLFSGSALFLAVGRLLVGLALLIFIFLDKNKKPDSWLAFSLIASGAIGNAIDGLRLGHVVDMIHWTWLSQITNMINGTSFPIFNLADSYVVGGTLLLILLAFVEPSSEKKKIDLHKKI